MQGTGQLYEDPDTIDSFAERDESSPHTRSKKDLQSLGIFERRYSYHKFDAE